MSDPTIYSTAQRDKLLKAQAQRMAQGCTRCDFRFRRGRTRTGPATAGGPA